MNQVHLIGKDLSKSKSQLIHEAIYNELDISWLYKSLEFKSSSDVYAFLNNVDNCFVSNVTYPYKTNVFKYFENKDFCYDEVSRFSNGCNLVITKTKQMFNFDGQGCVASLILDGVELKNKNILICGTGVTAKSIYYSLIKNNPNLIAFGSRKPDIGKIPKNSKVYNYDSLSKILKIFDVVIDTTPKILNTNSIIDVSMLNNDCFVMSVSYGIRQKILDESKQCGLNVVDGKKMLVAQAVFCIQKIVEQLNINNKIADNFKKMYNVGLNSI